jgi:hypothetical protein
MVKQNLCDYLFNIYPLPDELKDGIRRNELIQFINARLSVSYYSRRVLIQAEGMISDRIYFVNQGLVRGFTYDKVRDREKTVSLWDATALVTDASGFIHQTPSKLFIEVMPDTLLSSLSYGQLVEIFTLFPFIRSFMGVLMEYDFQYSNKRFADRHLSAWERLVHMRKSYQNLDQLVSKEVIASFLEITPQHLCKIIKENSRVKLPGTP